jgi:hypothetical protein
MTEGRARWAYRRVCMVWVLGPRRRLPIASARLLDAQDLDRGFVGALERCGASPRAPGRATSVAWG